MTLITYDLLECTLNIWRAPLVAQKVKHLPAMWETWVKFNVLKINQTVFYTGCTQEALYKGSHFSTSLSTFIFCCWIMAILVAVKWYLIVILICISLVTNEEKEMATHSSVLAWRIPGMVEPGGLPSVGSHGVGHDWSDLVVTNDFDHCFMAICISSLGKLLFGSFAHLKDFFFF